MARRFTVRTGSARERRASVISHGLCSLVLLAIVAFAGALSEGGRDGDEKALLAGDDKPVVLPPAG